MKTLLIVNATASSVTARTRIVIQQALSAENEVTVGETSRRGHASRLARQAATENYEAVVVLGGDGTLNETANGLAGTDVKLGVLPGGSTNVFARGIGMTNDPVEATAELIEAMHNDSWKRIGLGSLNSRYFMFHSGLGFDAAIVGNVERRGYLKRYAGHPWFVATALQTAFRGFDRKKPVMTMHLPDGETIDHLFEIIVLKVDPFTYLGSTPVRLCPDANLDSRLAVIALPKLDVIGTATKFFRGMRSDKGLRDVPGVIYRTDLDDIVVEGHEPFPYQMDGEYLGKADRLNFKFEPSCLSLFVPLQSMRR